MAEAEDVITDVARHVTIYARDLWQRQRKGKPAEEVVLRDIAQRLDLLMAAVFGTSFPIRVAQVPAPPTFLTKVFRRREGPRVHRAVPATDGNSIWLPARLPPEEQDGALEWYRLMALQQALRAVRQGPQYFAGLSNELQRSVFIVLSAHAADSALMQMLPGMRPSLQALRAHALQLRPLLNAFPAHRRPLEEFVRATLAREIELTPSPDSEQLAIEAAKMADALVRQGMSTHGAGAALYADLWTGVLRLPAQSGSLSEADAGANAPDPDAAPPRSARLNRTPEVRKPVEDEDDKGPGAWMIQTAQPHEQVEDPLGLQRPTDRDESTASDEFADALSELPEARLVSTPGRPKEVFISEDMPGEREKHKPVRSPADGMRLSYPEWDYRASAYLDAGVTIHLCPPREGPQAWVNQTLDDYRAMLALVRRRFEMLTAQRVRLHKQLEGEEIDLDACIDGYADFRAGLPLSQALYQTHRRASRDMAIVLLIDISGSTDGWISADKRIIDVEREALLLVSIALDGMREPYSVMGFSGEGPHGVTIRPVKSFDEPCSDTVARRIAALEPEHYTRTGAALRHASAMLMQQKARHRLLLLLSDGKPNDVDDYEGRYGVEDMRQAVTEARMQGINPFCLTIDRQAANYLPGVFGAHQYALLPKPELLPTALLEWMKRLLARS